MKQYEDSEYIVKGIETGDMRMPDTGMVERVMTSVIIDHKGKKFSYLGSAILLVYILF